MDFFYSWGIPPGALTLVLAVLAAVTALPRISRKMENPFLHAGAIFLFCAIAAAEIAVIKHADEVSNEHFRFLVARFDEQRNLIAAQKDATQNLATLLPSSVPSSALAPKTLKATIKSYIVPSLKQRAFELSAAILQQLASREFFARTPAPNSQSFEHDASIWVAYDRQTVEQYREQFEPAVRKIRDEFASQQLTDRYLQQFTNMDPPNSTAVRLIAEGIGNLAKKLKD